MKPALQGLSRKLTKLSAVVSFECEVLLKTCPFSKALHLLELDPCLFYSLLYYLWTVACCHLPIFSGYFHAPAALNPVGLSLPSSDERRGY